MTAGAYSKQIALLGKAPRNACASVLQAKLDRRDRAKEDLIATRRKVGDIRTAIWKHVDVEVAQREGIPEPE
jgi:hypothetical protein